MKYIKSFEQSNIEYENGDYVLLDVDKIIKSLNSGENPPEDKYAIIKNRLDGFQGYDYAVIFFNSEYNEVYEVKADEIIRLMNFAEIDEFDENKKIFKAQKNYNL